MYRENTPKRLSETNSPQLDLFLIAFDVQKYQANFLVYDHH